MPVRLGHISGRHRNKHKQTKMARAKKRGEKNNAVSSDDAESEFCDDDEFSDDIEFRS